MKQRDGTWSGDLQQLAQEHFGAARLGDQRRTKRLVYTAEVLLAHPQGSLSQKLADWADQVGCYRLLDAEAVTHAAVLEPHRQCTLAEMARHPVVLLLHDGTELDFGHIAAVREHLGQIGTGSGRGYICHNSLAVTPQRQVLGLASQILHRRRAVPEDETRFQRQEHPGRESRLWIEGCAASGSAAGTLQVDVADRLADVFEFLDYEVAAGRHFLIRCRHDRKLQGQDHVGADRICQKLWEYLEQLPLLATRQVKISAQAARPKVPARRARMARVTIRAGEVDLAVPWSARASSRGVPLRLWVIQVREEHPPAGEEALEWVLLTDLDSGTPEAALEHVDWYGCRPLIEEFHKGQKTGAGIEQLQLEATERLEPAIALLSVTSVILLQLRELAHRPEAEAAPASSVVPEFWVELLSGWCYGEKREMSVQEFVLRLGKLGGHLNRKRDGLPGWLTLWRGWCRFQAMLEGARAIRCRRCV